MKGHLLPRPAIVNQPQSEADTPQPDFLVERIKDLTWDTYLGLTVHKCDNRPTSSRTVDLHTANTVLSQSAL